MVVVGIAHARKLTGFCRAIKTIKGCPERAVEGGFREAFLAVVSGIETCETTA